MVNTVQLAKCSLCRTLAIMVLFTAVPLVHGQASGINITLGGGSHLISKTTSEGQTTGVFGLAYQQDLGRRFGVALDLF